ncbi:hypothetical protein RchiOBHm_Chr7g0199701 [Rosa chinensis]|uniref:Uncharacterized protein n=1 Tax=Rosa chinensis TaxID=74649 RepID=A0A2P6P7J7_ROSCH|nr:hypothetical protein RchiOBHm_Chr7g0199701 [Rosa chinensis]
MGTQSANLSQASSSSPSISSAPNMTNTAALDHSPLGQPPVGQTLPPLGASGSGGSHYLHFGLVKI